MLRWIGKAFLWVITKISRLVTFIVLVFGALVGCHDVNGSFDASRAIIAVYVFFVGLLVGFLIFGAQMSTLAWFVVVMVILFLMNMNKAWYVAKALLFHGGLDYVDEVGKVGSIRSVTPNEETICELHSKTAEVVADLSRNKELGTVRPLMGDMTVKQLNKGESDG